MKNLGMVTAGLGGVIALLAVAVGVQSIPDIRRYLKIRSM